MAVPDRIRLTDSLRQGPRKGPLLFGRPPEDRRLADLGPPVLDADEAALPPRLEELIRPGVPWAIRVVQKQIAPGLDRFHCGFQAVDPRDGRSLEEVHDHEIERLLREL